MVLSTVSSLYDDVTSNSHIILSADELRAKRLERLQQKKKQEVITVGDSNDDNGYAKGDNNNETVLIMNQAPNCFPSPPAAFKEKRRKQLSKRSGGTGSPKKRRISLSPPPLYGAVASNSDDEDDEDENEDEGENDDVVRDSIPDQHLYRNSSEVTATPPHPITATSATFKLKRVQAQPSVPLTTSRAKAALKAKPKKATPKTGTLPNGVLFSSKHLMLAKKWEEDKYDCRNFLMSEKLDGWRALWDGTKLITRSGAPIDAPSFFTEGFPTNIALDGELFHGRQDFQIASSILKSSSNHPGWKHLKFVVFDAPSVNGHFEHRLNAVQKLVSDVGSVAVPHLQVHPHIECRGKDHLSSELARIMDLGGEGLMLRQKKSPYQPGRSSVLMKVKAYSDDEALVLGYKEGKGRYSNKMGALLCRLRNGTKFFVGTGFTDVQRETPPVVGSVFTFRYCDTTNRGARRHASFLRLRSDLDPSEFHG